MVTFQVHVYMAQYKVYAGVNEFAQVQHPEMSFEVD